MCIYYGKSENLTYEKQEHVIPAGLGGHIKLGKGVVSDQANFIDWDMLRNKFLSMGDKYIPVVDARFGEKIFIAYHKDKITM